MLLASVSHFSRNSITCRKDKNSFTAVHRGYIDLVGICRGELTNSDRKNRKPIYQPSPKFIRGTDPPSLAIPNISNKPHQLRGINPIRSNHLRNLRSPFLSTWTASSHPLEAAIPITVLPRSSFASKSTPAFRLNIVKISRSPFSTACMKPFQPR